MTTDIDFGFDAPCPACGCVLAGGFAAPPVKESELLWLGRAGSLRLKPSTPKAARLAREAMASFWSLPGGKSPPVTLHDVIAFGASLPELHITYIYNN
jgi:hypothetical protein